MTPKERATAVVNAFRGDEYWIDTDAAIIDVAGAIEEEREAYKDLVGIATGILECLDQGDLWTKPARKHAAGLLRAALAKVGTP